MNQIIFRIYLMATNIGLDKHPSTNSKPSVLLSPALHPGFSPDATQAQYPTSEPVPRAPRQKHDTNGLHFRPPIR